MTARELIDFLGVIEKLKCATRHCITTSGRQESVAEHSWRLATMAMLCAGEVPEVNMDRVIKLCLVHDFGEAITGDIPTFIKTENDSLVEENAVEGMLSSLPDREREELRAMFSELSEQKTPEAKLAKALDKLEALISHNEADISSWLPLEYDLQLTYGQTECSEFSFTRKLRDEAYDDSVRKIEESRK